MSTTDMRKFMHIIDFNAEEDNQYPGNTPQTSGLLTLPVEILFMIHLLSDSKDLSCTCKYLNAVYKYTTPVHRAKYIIARYNLTFWPRIKRFGLSFRMRCAVIRNDIITFALRFRMCNEATLEAMVNMKDCPVVYKNSRVRLPRWLFRNLEDKPLTKDSHPLPLLHFLFSKNKLRLRLSRGDPMFGTFGWTQAAQNSLPRTILTPDIDSYEGYALVRAVRANHIPLIRFLLDHGAKATHMNYLALREAIHERDLNLVKMLIEKDTGDQNVNENGKRPRTEDRIVVTQWILEKAVDEGLKAREIVKYFIEEKGVTPDWSVQEKIDKKGFFKDTTVTRRRIASRKR